jgi:hypothetical protein
VTTQRQALEMIPAARRLITSLRDMGYEFSTAVADLVDNSIEAGATLVAVDVEFEGIDSWVRVSDNGSGMTAAALREGLRYGSMREYSSDALGKFGLGLKVASLSQCQRLSVASCARGERSKIAAYCWDLGHIERTNRWELIELDDAAEHSKLFAPLQTSTGTVVLWQRLDRLLGYQDPSGESARRRMAHMSRDVAGHLSMVFHRFLSGEVPGRRLRISVNGNDLSPWDPFARGEAGTAELERVAISVSHMGRRGELTLEPFVLPHQSDFSTSDSFRMASGPSNWNQQQGFYVYRSHRLLQSGGWCRIRTTDEHTKLARIALHFSPKLDDLFRVNVSKMRVQLPAHLRERVADAITPVIKLANLKYRKTRPRDQDECAARGPLPRKAVAHVITRLLSIASTEERRVIRKLAARLHSN